jgi:integrase
MHAVLYDAAGHRRTPVTMPGFHEGRAPRNKGRRYPADPPTVEEIIAVMRAAGSGADGARLRALVVILWRTGLRIGEALGLAETDLDAPRGAVLVRSGLCRIRHNPRYAEARVMPSRLSAARVCMRRGWLGWQAARHNFRGQAEASCCP